MNKRISGLFLSEGYLSKWVVLLMDLVLSLVATLLALLLLRIAMRVTYFSFPLLLICGISAVASVLAFLVCGTHKVVIRHSSFKTIWRLILSALLKDAILAVGLYYLCRLPVRQIIIITFADVMFTGALLLLVRLVMIFTYDLVLAKLADAGTHRILIYGISDESVALKIRLRKSPYYSVAGFLVYGKKTGDMTVSDISCRYFTDREEFEKTVSALSISAVLFATEKDAKAEADRLISYIGEMSRPVRVLIAPRVNEVNPDNPLPEGRMRPIRIEDLLGRDEIVVNNDEILASVYGKVVMVTGGAGSIGSELCRQLARSGVRKLVILDNAETPLHNIRIELETRYPGFEYVPYVADVRLKGDLRTAFETHRPQLVFHAAAYKHVPLMELFPCEAVRANVLGTKNVADLAVEYGVEKMVMISTDKAVNPTNVMGCTKRLAEIYCQSLGLAVSEGRIRGKTLFVTTRFGNVLGSNGSVIPMFAAQIESGGPVTVTDERITRFFMTIPEACRLVLEAAVMGKANEIMVFDMGEPVRIVDVARKMIQLAGYVPDRDIQIRFVGLRPGEKLYEEVLSSEENTLPTDNPKIRVAKVREYDPETVNADFEALIAASFSNDSIATVRKMKDIVPEYISNNSVFEALDVRQ